MKEVLGSCAVPGGEGGESQDQMAERRERAQEGGRAMPAIIDKAQGLSVEEMHPLDLL